MKVQVTFGRWEPGDPWRRLYTYTLPEGVEAEPGDQFRTPQGARVTVVEVGSEYAGPVIELVEIEEEETDGEPAAA